MKINKDNPIKDDFVRIETKRYQTLSPKSVKEGNDELIKVRNKQARIWSALANQVIGSEIIDR